MTLQGIVNDLRNSELVREKDLGNGISSFNFSRKAFWKKRWTSMSTKARGLFIDIDNMRVKARAYDKFFHVGERRETGLQYIQEEWTYPIDFYVKENGYLGICSWNEDGTLFCASKSTTEGWYAGRFRELLEQTLGNKVEMFSKFLRMENLSAVFEVIDPKEDAHIIEYDKPHVVLLDLIYNDWGDFENLKFVNKNYGVLVTWGKTFNLKIKEHAYRAWNAEQLEAFYHKVIAPGYQYKGRYIEGFVLEDLDLHHAKLKTDYYNYWKQLRNIIPAIRKGETIDLSRVDLNIHPETPQIMRVIREYAAYYYSIHQEDVSIIEIRKLWQHDIRN